MQKRIFPLFLLIIPFILVFLNGCGEDDQGGLFYSGYIVAIDNDEETLSIDIIQDDCDGEPEDFGPSSVEVAITVSDIKAGIKVNSYDIEYTSVLSDSGDGSGTMIMSPDISGISGSYTIDIDTGEEVTFEVPCFTVSQKASLVTAMATAGLTIDATYTIQITLYCTDTYGESVEIVLTDTVLFYDVDNC